MHPCMHALTWVTVSDLIGWCGHRHMSVEDVNISGARIIAQACKDAGVDKLIHVSALNADKHSQSRFLRSKVD